jgi:predicted metal-dependent hydrolase
MAALFRSPGRLASQKPLEPSTFTAGGDVLAVLFRRHAQARRMVLRLNSDGTAVLVTVPKGVSRTQALAFTERSRPWIETHIKKRGQNIPLKAGSHIPFRGTFHEIRHLPLRRGTVAADPLNAIIHVPGELPHVARRLTDWLKSVARAELTVASARYAVAMGVNYRRITIRDQRSRWGSCSAAGDLSYSWRLILTPPYVLDYVAAHEVAHLRYLDHSPGFWRLVLTHCPDAARAKKWLKTHGHDVHRIVA